MNRLLSSVLLVLVMVTSCYGEKCYVFIDKNSSETAKEVGQNERGDIVTILSATPQHKPTRTELQTYKIVVVDLTLEEQESLLEPDGKYACVRERKRKIDVGNLVAKQEEEIDKATLFNTVIDKSVLSP